MLKQHTGMAARDDFIAAMRRVASSVTVVTTDGPAGRCGATVSAFTSVSADPPTVLVCLFGQSRIAQSVAENGRFCVNVLPEACVDIANRFAGRDDASISDRFSGIGLTDGCSTPQIAGSTAFDCSLSQSIVSGSHLIIIGHVRSVADAGATPLTYREGGYHRVIPYAVSASNQQDGAET